MNAAKKALHAVDQRQQETPWLAFPVAVWKKFGDDQAGNLAALIAYYAFASIFPLLLVLVTVLDLVLGHDPALRQSVLSSAFGQFPVIGAQLKSNVHSLPGTGLALVIGLVLTFLGTRGVAAAAQNAFNTAWGVPIARRPGFPKSALRSVAMIIVVGTGIIATTLLSGLAGGGAAASVLSGPGAYIGAIAVSLLLNIGLFWLGFRLATASEVTTRELFLGALLAAIVWQILQLLGGYLVAHSLSKSSSLYGVFGVVLGLIAWLYLQAELTLYAVEAAVVKSRKLWPRTLFPPPLHEPDCRAYDLYAQTQQRFPGQEIDTRIAEDPTKPPAEQGKKDTPPAKQGQKNTAPAKQEPERGKRSQQKSRLSRLGVAALAGAALAGAAQELARWRSRSR
jgi:membrane protein